MRWKHVNIAIFSVEGGEKNQNSPLTTANPTKFTAKFTKQLRHRKRCKKVMRMTVNVFTALKPFLATNNRKQILRKFTAELILPSAITANKFSKKM